jgi:hypothetical protein
MRSPPPDANARRAALAGDPVAQYPTSRSTADTAIAPGDLQARRLRRQFAIGDYLAASLALLIWGVAR